MQFGGGPGFRACQTASVAFRSDKHFVESSTNFKLVEPHTHQAKDFSGFQTRARSGFAVSGCHCPPFRNACKNRASRSWLDAYGVEPPYKCKSLQLIPRKTDSMKKITYVLIPTLCVLAVSLLAFLSMRDEVPVSAPAEALETPAPVVTQERVCLDCHRYPNVNTNEGVLTSQAQCYECHLEKKRSLRKMDKRTLSLQVTPDTFDKNPHQYVACIQCHTDVARSPHKTVAGAQCRSCHGVHGEGTAHDPHLRVACQACHRKSEFVRLDPEDHQIKLAHTDDKGQAVALTDHALPDDVQEEKACQKCHNTGNKVGAPVAVLPSKSFLCIICHNAPLAMGHFIFWIALLVFIFGMFVMLRFWFQGSVQGEEESMHRKIVLSSEAVWETLFSRKILHILKVFFFDILLQRRILKESVGRWSMHSLIYVAILFRFLLSFFGFLHFSLNPESSWALALLDKNHGFTAFIYDLLGLFILAGIAWVMIQRFILKPVHVKTEIEDNVTVALVAILILLGFGLEGMRIEITNIPPDMAAYSFVGYPIAYLLSLSQWDWAGLYAYVWYAHALAAATFVAYLPYGKLRHVFNVPLTYFLEEIAGEKRR